MLAHVDNHAGNNDHEIGRSILPILRNERVVEFVCRATQVHEDEGDEQASRAVILLLFAVLRGCANNQE